MTQQFQGFDLFNDQDDALRTRNRACVLSNIFQDNSKDAKLTPKGLKLVLGYFQQIPADERKTVEQAFTEQMKQRGFIQQA